MKTKKILAYLVCGISLGITVIVGLTASGKLAVNPHEFGKTLGALTLAPTLLAVVMTLISANVLLSLAFGFLIGSLCIALGLSGSLAEVPLNLAQTVIATAKQVCFDSDNLMTLLLCIAIAGLIGIITATGGFEALAAKLIHRINSSRKAMLLAQLTGLLIFFDDYASALIVGPLIRPMARRLKISKEKLGYIANVTAAPVAALALITSWIAVELSVIEEGLANAGSSLKALPLFIGSIPFCLYCLLALLFALMVILSARDFGPMYAAECSALLQSSASENSTANSIDDKSTKRIVTALGSVVLLVLISIVMFVWSGQKNACSAGLISVDAALTFNNLMVILGNADTTRVITISSLIVCLLAAASAVILKLFDVKEAFIACWKGVLKMLPTLIMLLAAWCLAKNSVTLGAVDFVSEVVSSRIPWIFVPALVFVVCCLISFAVGSFGTMFIVMPIAIPLVFALNANGVSMDLQQLLVIVIGAVIGGSVFGDQSSPVTDCTILSAEGAECNTMELAKAQLPYSLVVVAVTALAGYLPLCLGLDIVLTLAVDTVILLIILLLFGKTPKEINRKDSNYV